MHSVQSQLSALRAQVAEATLAKIGWTDEARRAAAEARKNGSKKDLTSQEHVDSLKSHLQMVKGIEPKTAEGVVADQGRIYPFSESSYKCDKGEQGLCYMNAGRIAMHDPSKTYVEGFISVHGVPIQHAWLADENGHVIDPTLKDGKGVKAYIGVPFKQDYVTKTALRTKYWGILSKQTNKKVFDDQPSKYLAKFDESKHPRDSHGRWTDGNDVSAQDLLRLHSTGNETIDDVEKQLTPKQIEMIKSAEAGMKGQKTTMEQFKNADGMYTDERAALHEKIVNDMFTPEKVAAATPKAGEAPTLTMTGGRPASGKTSALRDELKGIGDHSFYVSADEIQEKLPGYNGAHAGLYNGEAQDIATQVEKVARDNGLNVTYDATMKTEKTALERVKEYKDAGYKVNAYFVHTAPTTSAVRTVQRFERSGRYVPPHVSLNSKSNEKTFDALKPHVDNWALYDNNGSAPKLIARGGTSIQKAFDEGQHPRDKDGKFSTANYVAHSIPMSERRHEIGYMEEYHEDRGSKPEIMDVNPKTLRATQDGVDSTWTPERSKNAEMPVAVVDKGEFHIVDGHHRANHALANGETLKMKVYNHNGHNSRFKRWMDSHLS